MSENQNNSENTQNEKNTSAEKENRKEKLNTLRNMGINPFPNSYDVTYKSHDIAEKFDELEKNQTEVSIAGRIMLYRVMGKSSFLTIKDSQGTIQAYIQRDKVGDEFYNTVFKKLIDIGDIVGIKGTVFKTKTGEITVYASELKLLTKSLNPLPEKFHGLTDTELRYRQRYVDLIMNDDVKEAFIKRSKMISAIREVMIEHNFLEVETPMMHPLIGGAKAKPFVTHHNTLDMTLYLRIAPELYLKRLVVGGFDRVFELNRNFRNEGISTRHNPEFTMMEAYMAYANFYKVMELVEDVFSKVCYKLNGKYTSVYKDYEINFKPPFARVPMVDLVKEHSGLDFNAIESDDEAIEKAKSIGVEIDTSKTKPTKWEVMAAVFEDRVEEKLIQPTFVINYPKAVSPLSKSYPDNPDITERYELFIGGMELSNGFSELNDPIDQKERFEEQLKAKARGEDETMDMDLDYINALEYGLPPTGGLGIGIDRMAILFLNAASIRDTILFPQMRKSDQ
ncbi:lysine--tRNA ligase [uncultured Brachyspira sp.]|uniref:lysine--tRNA ligase n=1 Tax=uncultured Brachyspira sp. TaxID=221953 RepID=UPI00260CDC75|nr:lysine--tRNA ligase [uncultured Brachyspira sp.]